MTKRLFARVIAVAAVVAAISSLAPGPAAAQSWVTDSVCPDDAHLAFHRCALEAAKTFDPPRNAYGDPDLSGFWRRRAAAHESIEEHPRTPDDSGATSAVVDPADGIVPIQPWADAQRMKNREEYVHHNAVCRLSGVPVSMYMTGTYQFLQNSEFFVVQGEEAHAYRIIPTDGRAHIPDTMRLWNGDSVGRWEGNTLVVETTNQNGIPWLDQRGRFYTEQAHVVERFTLIDPHTLHYQVTLDDLNVYTRPFTLAIAFRRSTVEGQELWEEACYENNDIAMQNFRNVGYEIYDGITAEEARQTREAWEAQETGR